jgi:uncharacterized protein (TIGR02679 family)
VCLEGLPTTAALELLRSFADGGSRIRFHADFDWGGIRIGNVVCATLAARPWRFGTSDYEEAVERVGTAAPLDGNPIGASWDPELRASMSTVGKRVYEEQLLSLLLDDLCGR